MKRKSAGGDEEKQKRLQAEKIIHLCRIERKKKDNEREITRNLKARYVPCNPVFFFSDSENVSEDGTENFSVADKSKTINSVLKKTAKGNF